MRKSLSAFMMLCVICSVRAAVGQTAADHVTVSIAADKHGDWTVAKLKTDFARDLKSVEYESHGVKHKANAVSLLTVLKSAGLATGLKMDPSVDPKVKNHLLRLVVVVRGSDGYTVSFSLAELLPDIGDRECWLALDEDGKPLAPNQGPIRLLVPQDEKPGRWVHSVASIAVVDPAKQPATRPADH